MSVSLPFINLESGAFTVPKSRFVLTVNRNIINVFYTSYEVEMENCLVAKGRIFVTSSTDSKGSDTAR